MTVIARDDVTLALVTDVASTAHYFQLKVSTASAPTAPTVYPASSPWVTTEPTYTEGATNSLYTVDVTVFSDGTFDYTPVSLSSSYEAAKAAYNKAKQAQSAATSAQTAANLALTNAQNMVMNTGHDLENTWNNYGVTAENGVYTRTFPGNENHVDFLKGSLSGKAIPGHAYSFSLDARSVSGDYIPDDGFLFGWNDDWFAVIVKGLSGDWQRFTANATTMGDGKDNTFFFIASYVSSDGAKVVQFRNLSIKDITEAQAAQKSADDAQSTADKAQVAADNAASIANAAKAAAQGAQTTADGKNKIFSAVTQPSATGLVPGDLWFQLDASKNVTGIQVWNGSAFTDMVLLANKLIVASSVGTTQIADNAIVTGKIAANAITAINIAAQTITGDKLDVGSVAAAIVTSGLFQTATSGARVVMDSTGIKAYDPNNNMTFQVDAGTGNVILSRVQAGANGAYDIVDKNNTIMTRINGAGMFIGGSDSGNAFAHVSKSSKKDVSAISPSSENRDTFSVGNSDNWNIDGQTYTDTGGQQHSLLGFSVDSAGSAFSVDSQLGIAPYRVIDIGSNTHITYTNGWPLPRIRMGSVVVTPNHSARVQIMSLYDVNSMLGHKWDPQTNFVMCMNGDRSANDANVIAADFDNGLNAVLDRVINTPFRVNWILFDFMWFSQQV